MDVQNELTMNQTINPNDTQSGVTTPSNTSGAPSGGVTAGSPISDPLAAAAERLQLLRDETKKAELELLARQEAAEQERLQRIEALPAQFGFKNAHEMGEFMLGRRAVSRRPPVFSGRTSQAHRLSDIQREHLKTDFKGHWNARTLAKKYKVSPQTIYNNAKAMGFKLPGYQRAA